MGQMKDLIMEKYIGYYEEVVPHVLCNDIVNYGFNFKSSTFTGKAAVERVRMDEVWIKEGNLYYNDIKAAFNHVIRKYAEEHPLFGVQHITDFRLNLYSKNGFMIKHIDNIHHSHGQQYGYPQVSVLLFLNEDYRGGEFVVADKVYYTEKGSALIFPSNFMFPHEVKLVTEGTRWSILAWLM